ncbi:hypothetical protein E2C01_078558 [Portunus trituberculatus]|uniref:Uncharacterized protein n=1 Tax=Portunus trituberculatus TaxID=210409 RepID=A0A5B7IP53_PORTR|nr:hypothetical protein [Portunus trituberculatus]
MGSAVQLLPISGAGNFIYSGTHIRAPIAVVQWDRVCFVGPRIFKRTGSNPGHGLRLGRAFARGNSSQMPKLKSS